MKPTDKQIKEFWEWCGFTAPVIISDGDIEVGTPLPPIDLNNLFLYAVPKVVSIDLQTWTSEPHATLATVYSQGNNPVSIWDKDPALALFWAIYSVFDK